MTSAYIDQSPRNNAMGSTSNLQINIGSGTVTPSISRLNGKTSSMMNIGVTPKQQDIVNSTKAMAT